MGLGTDVRCGAGEKGKFGLGEGYPKEGTWLTGMKPKLRSLGTFLSKTVEEKESIKQITADDQRDTEGKSRQRKVL